MFDIFGETAPVPLPDLEMTPADAPDREKAFWEKELTGVSFSEKPFSPVFGKDNANTTFCGQVDAELAEQSVVVAGRVVSARYLLTRDGRSFANAILEDFSGQVEVMVWPKVYAETDELWKEGNELVVQGKVRVREDQAQISCDRVTYYQPPREGEETSPPAEPAAVKAPREKPAPVPSPPAERHRLTINIKQTNDADGDIASLNKIVTALRVYPGHDEVRLNILNGGDAIPLRLPNIATGYCAELQQQLLELVGEDGLQVETAN
jgi:DNA polymerase-3 subunit alpha